MDTLITVECAKNGSCNPCYNLRLSPPKPIKSSLKQAEPNLKTDKSGRVKKSSVQIVLPSTSSTLTEKKPTKKESGFPLTHQNGQLSFSLCDDSKRISSTDNPFASKQSHVLPSATYTVRSATYKTKEGNDSSVHDQLSGSKVVLCVKETCEELNAQADSTEGIGCLNCCSCLRKTGKCKKKKAKEDTFSSKQPGIVSKTNTGTEVSMMCLSCCPSSTKVDKTDNKTSKSDDSCCCGRKPSACRVDLKGKEERKGSVIKEKKNKGKKGSKNKEKNEGTDRRSRRSSKKAQLCGCTSAPDYEDKCRNPTCGQVPRSSNPVIPPCSCIICDQVPIMRASLVSTKLPLINLSNPPKSLETSKANERSPKTESKQSVSRTKVVNYSRQNVEQNGSDSHELTIPFSKEEVATTYLKSGEPSASKNGIRNRFVEFNYATLVEHSSSSLGFTNKNRFPLQTIFTVKEPQKPVSFVIDTEAKDEANCKTTSLYPVIDIKQDPSSRVINDPSVRVQQSKEQSSQGEQQASIGGKCVVKDSRLRRGLYELCGCGRRLDLVEDLGPCICDANQNIRAQCKCDRTEPSESRNASQYSRNRGNFSENEVLFTSQHVQNVYNLPHFNNNNGVFSKTKKRPGAQNLNSERRNVWDGSGNDSDGQFHNLRGNLGRTRNSVVMNLNGERTLVGDNTLVVAVDTEEADTEVAVGREHSLLSLAAGGRESRNDMSVRSHRRLRQNRLTRCRSSSGDSREEPSTEQLPEVESRRTHHSGKAAGRVESRNDLSRKSLRKLRNNGHKRSRSSSGDSREEPSTEVLPEAESWRIDKSGKPSPVSVSEPKSSNKSKSRSVKKSDAGTEGSKSKRQDSIETRGSVDDRTPLVLNSRKRLTNEEPNSLGAELKHCRSRPISKKGERNQPDSNTNNVGLIKSINKNKSNDSVIMCTYLNTNKGGLPNGEPKKKLRPRKRNRKHYLDPSEALNETVTRLINFDEIDEEPLVAANVHGHEIIDVDNDKVVYVNKSTELLFVSDSSDSSDSEEDSDPTASPPLNDETSSVYVNKDSVIIINDSGLSESRNTLENMDSSKDLVLNESSVTRDSSQGLKFSETDNSNKQSFATDTVTLYPVISTCKSRTEYAVNAADKPAIDEVKLHALLVGLRNDVQQTFHDHEQLVTSLTGTLARQSREVHAIKALLKNCVQRLDAGIVENRALERRARTARNEARRKKKQPAKGRRTETDNGERRSVNDKQIAYMNAANREPYPKRSSLKGSREKALADLRRTRDEFVEKYGDYSESEIVPKQLRYVEPKRERYDGAETDSGRSASTSRSEYDEFDYSFGLPTTSDDDSFSSRFEDDGSSSSSSGNESNAYDDEYRYRASTSGTGTSRERNGAEVDERRRKEVGRESKDMETNERRKETRRVGAETETDGRRENENRRVRNGTETEERRRNKKSKESKDNETD